MISHHFHPWIERQGESPFVWSVIGAIAASTGCTVTTGVTCPTVRIHPAIIAQAAATSSLLLGEKAGLSDILYCTNCRGPLSSLERK